MFCAVLGIKCREHNGTWSRVEGLFRDAEAKGRVDSGWGTVDEEGAEGAEILLTKPEDMEIVMKDVGRDREYKFSVKEAQEKPTSEKERGFGVKAKGR